jgi:hypothetical protein
MFAVEHCLPPEIETLISTTICAVGSLPTVRVFPPSLLLDAPFDFTPPT